MTVDFWDAHDSVGLPTREFRLAGNDVVREVTGAVWLPRTRPRPALVCFGHGASGDRYQFPSAPLAAALTNAGIAMLALDGPDHGLRRSGAGGRDGMVNDLLRQGCMDDMAADWNRAIEVVADVLPTNVDRIGYFGLSMGAAYGIPFAAQRPDMSAAVVGLWADLEAMPQNETVIAAAHTLQAPTVFLMQTDDEFLPPDRSLSLYMHLGADDKRLHGNPGPHAQVPVDEITYCTSFLIDHLAGPASRDRRAMGHIIDDHKENS